MNFLPLDYVLMGAAAFLATLGLVRGFSGEIGSACGWAAGAAAAYFGWQILSDILTVRWQLIVATVVVTIVSFGLARVLVKRFVHAALARPTDAFLGLLLGLAKVFVVAFVLINYEWGTDSSVLLKELSAYVR